MDISIPALILIVLAHAFIAFRVYQEWKAQNERDEARERAIRLAIQYVGLGCRENYFDPIVFLEELIFRLDGTNQHDAIWQLIWFATAGNNEEALRVLRYNIHETTLREALSQGGPNRLAALNDVRPVNSTGHRLGLKFALLALDRRSQADLDNEISQADADALRSQIRIAVLADDEMSATG